MRRWAVVAVIGGVLGLLFVLGPTPGPDLAEQTRADAARRAEERSVSQYSTTTTPTVAATASGTVPDKALTLIDSPTEANAIAAVTAMAESGDPNWVPYLVDLLRLFGSEVAFDATSGALADLTGRPPPDAVQDTYAFYGSWMYDARIDAGPAYVAWKAALYEFIDPAFRPLIAQIDDPVIAAELQWGGVRRGGIPELNDPETATSSSAGYMTPGELTFGAVIAGVPRAYPHRILDHHELANDVLGGEPVALANCTLCRTGVLFSRRVGDLVLEFETSGLLRNSNKVMVDRQTESLWNQLTGVAIAGPLAGTTLDRFPLVVDTWAAWVEAHPTSDVVTIPGGYGYSYEPGDAYADYYAGADLWFPVIATPPVFEPKAEVATLDVDGLRLAVSIGALADTGPTVFAVGDRTVVGVPTGPGARFYDASVIAERLEAGTTAAVVVAEGTVAPDAIEWDGITLQRLQSGQSFWFAWYANFPDTEWWAG